MMTEVFPQLFIGNSFDGKNEQEIVRREINHIINFAEDLELVDFSKIDMRFIRNYNKLGLTDGHGNSFQKLFSCAIYLYDCLNAGQKVLVHCHEGRSRSPSIVIFALILWKRMPFDEGFSLIKEKRPEISINPNLEKDVRKVGEYLLKFEFF